MQIDAVIARIQSAPTTQLYATVIAVSLAFSFYLLNSGGGSVPMMNDANNSEVDDSLHKPSKIMKAGGSKTKGASPLDRTSTNNEAEPEPRWHILKITNYLAASGFILSVLQFASNASTYLNDSASLLQFLSVWSVFLCYFFGFFGISFIELDELVGQQQQQQVPSAVAQQAAASAQQQHHAKG